LELLEFLKACENQVGRIERYQNGPREIDLDILLFNDLVYNSDKLNIPHPRIPERVFVLRPLIE